MRKEMTYADLLTLEKDINAQGIAFKIFHKSQIDHFFRNNSLRLDVAKKTINTLLAKHIEADENNNLRSINKIDGSKEFIWKKPSSKAAYEKECTDFLSLTVEVFL